LPAADWAEHEFGAVKLPDARLRQRLFTLARDFYARPTANVPQACGSRGLCLERAAGDGEGDEQGRRMPAPA